jgi:hypothetical protein
MVHTQPVGFRPRVEAEPTATAPGSVDSVGRPRDAAPIASLTFTGDADGPARPLPSAGALSPATAAPAVAGPRHRQPTTRPRGAGTDRVVHRRAVPGRPIPAIAGRAHRPLIQRRAQNPGPAQRAPPKQRRGTPARIGPLTRGRNAGQTPHPSIGLTQTSGDPVNAGNADGSSSPRCQRCALTRCCITRLVE